MKTQRSGCFLLVLWDKGNFADVKRVKGSGWGFPMPAAVRALGARGLGFLMGQFKGDWYTWVCFRHRLTGAFYQGWRI